MQHQPPRQPAENAREEFLADPGSASLHFELRMALALLILAKEGVEPSIREIAAASGLNTDTVVAYLPPEGETSEHGLIECQTRGEYREKKCSYAGASLEDFDPQALRLLDPRLDIWADARAKARDWAAAGRPAWTLLALLLLSGADTDRITIAQAAELLGSRHRANRALAGLQRALVAWRVEPGVYDLRLGNIEAPAAPLGAVDHCPAGRYQATRQSMHAQAVTRAEQDVQRHRAALQRQLRHGRSMLAVADVFGPYEAAELPDVELIDRTLAVTEGAEGRPMVEWARQLLDEVVAGGITEQRRPALLAALDTYAGQTAEAVTTTPFDTDLQARLMAAVCRPQAQAS